MTELPQLWTVALAHLVVGTLFLVPVALVAWIHRDATARLLDALYSIGWLKLVLPLSLIAPWLSTPWRAMRETPDLWGMVSAPAVALMVEPHSGAGAAPGVEWGAAAWTAVWAAGATLCLLRLARRFRNAPRRDDERPVEELPPERAKALRDGLTLTALYAGDVRVVSHGPGPYVDGVVRPRIVIPEPLLARLTPDELRAVLLHEREHLRRRDPLRYAALAVVRALLWFWPPVWWLGRRLRETAELSCDEAVARAGVPAAVFRRALAETVRFGLVTRAAHAPVGMLGHGSSFLARRLRRNRIQGRWTMTTTQRTTVIALALVAIALSTLPASPPEGDEPSIARVYAGPGTAVPSGSTEKPLLAGTDGVTNPKRIKDSIVNPVYPEAARLEKAEGRVILQAVIDEQGKVGEIEILSNQAEREDLAEAAAAAIRQWRYEPATKDGEPVAVYFTIVVEFALDRHGKRDPEKLPGEAL